MFTEMNLDKDSGPENKLRRYEPEEVIFKEESRKDKGGREIGKCQGQSVH